MRGYIALVREPVFLEQTGPRRLEARYIDPGDRLIVYYPCGRVLLDEIIAPDDAPEIPGGWTQHGYLPQKWLWLFCRYPAYRAELIKT